MNEPLLAIDHIPITCIDVNLYGITSEFCSIVFENLEFEFYKNFWIKMRTNEIAKTNSFSQLYFSKMHFFEARIGDFGKVFIWPGEFGLFAEWKN